MSSLLAPDAPYKPYRPISTGSASPLKPITLVDAHGYSPSHSGDVDVDGEFHDSQFQFRLEQDSRDDAVSRISACKSILWGSETNVDQ